MKRKIQKLAFRLFKYCINADDIDAFLKNNYIEKNSKNVLLGQHSRLYPESRIFNFQNDANKIKIGENTHIRGELLVFANGGQINIGNNSYIGRESVLWSQSLIDIGNDVLISHNCNIIDTNSHEMNYEERAASYRSLIKFGHPKTATNVLSKPIIIKDYAWISFNVSILKGVEIGKGAIIAAGSMVTKDVPDFTLVAGNPARFIKNVKYI